MNPILSLWILKDWLEEFSPAIQCKNERTEIAGTRLYQPDMQIKDDILYLGPSDDFFHDGDRRIVCRHRSDFLRLETCDLWTVSNRIQDAFAFYAHWYESCMHAITAGYSLPVLLKRAAEVFPAPIMIVNAAQILVAQSADLSGVIAPEDWDSVVENYSLPEEKLKQFNQVYKDTFYTKGVMSIPPGFFPTKSYCIHILVNEERLGTVILKAPGKDHTKGTLHLLELFAAIVQQWIQSDEENAADFRLTSNFAYALEGKPGALSALRRQLSLFEWDTDCKKQLFVVAASKGRVPFDIRVSWKLAKENLGIFALLYQGKLVFLCNLDMLSYEDLAQSLCSILKENNCYGASSIPFTQLDQLLTAYQQVLTAAEHSPKHPGMLYRCQDAAMHMVVQIVQEATRGALIHPALSALKAHDLAHKTDYCQTLFCFLKNERRHQQTAEELFIHRNTLFLRLEKIQELWPLDLSDAEERFYLLFSFYQDRHSFPLPADLTSAGTP